MIYLDHNATTRVDKSVVASMLEVLEGDFGNPSSGHPVGAAAAAKVEAAREQVAALIGARESEIVFVSGGTESDNTAIRGIIAARPQKRHVIVSATEHHAVIDVVHDLERHGFDVTILPVDVNGRINPSELAGVIRPETVVVSIMLANNETGVIQPLREAAAVCRERGVPFHTDAVQAVGKIHVNVNELGVDLLSLSGHKIHGPKGVGALYVRRGTAFRPFMLGGHQERDRRGGTHNVPGIVGLGAACSRLRTADVERVGRIRRLRERLERELTARFANAHVMGAAVERLPNTTCVCFEGVEAEGLLVLLSQADICASSGAACSSGSLEPSHVLKAMGVAPEIGQGEIRFSLGEESTDGDIDELMEVLPGALAKVSALNQASGRVGGNAV